MQKVIIITNGKRVYLDIEEILYAKMRIQFIIQHKILDKVLVVLPPIHQVQLAL